MISPPPPPPPPSLRRHPPTLLTVSTLTPLVTDFPRFLSSTVDTTTGDISSAKGIIDGFSSRPDSPISDLLLKQNIIQPIISPMAFSGLIDSTMNLQKSINSSQHTHPILIPTTTTTTTPTYPHSLYSTTFSTSSSDSPMTVPPYVPPLLRSSSPVFGLLADLMLPPQSAVQQFFSDSNTTGDDELSIKNSLVTESDESMSIVESPSSSISMFAIRDSSNS